MWELPFEELHKYISQINLIAEEEGYIGEELNENNEEYLDDFDEEQEMNLINFFYIIYKYYGWK